MKLSTLHLICFSQQPHEISSIIITLLHIRMLKYKEVKQPGELHLAYE